MVGLMKLMLNSEVVEVRVAPGEVVLDLVRDHLGLRATKEGCREGDCGACTVLVGEPDEERIRYRAVNSCILPVGSLEGCHLVTLEGINSPDLTPVQALMVAEGASQCGFCTPGVVMAATAYLLEADPVSKDGLIRALAGNICRCTGYGAIIRAMRSLADRFAALPSPGRERIDALVNAGVLPAYFSAARETLDADAPLPERGAFETGLTPVGGGTDLFVQRARAMLKAPVLFVRRPDTVVIEERSDGIFIEGSATVDDLQAAGCVRDLIPRLDEIAAMIASPQIRSRATVGGNIANASPIGDVSILLLALDARIALATKDGRRDLPLKDLFRGYKDLDMGPDELIESVTIPARDGDFRLGFEKVSRRTHMDIASVNSAMGALVDGGRIAAASISAGGVAPVPRYLERTSAYLAGKKLCRETALEASRIASAEVTPIDDVRGTAGYKRNLLGRLVLAHFATALEVEVTP